MPQSNGKPSFMERWRRRQYEERLVEEMRSDLDWDEDYRLYKADMNPWTWHGRWPHEPDYVDRLFGYEVEW